MRRTGSLAYLVTVSRQHTIPARVLLRTLRAVSDRPIVLVGNLDADEIEELTRLGATYIDERDIDLGGRMPHVSWDTKHRHVGWYRQMFIRLAIDRFMAADHVVILDSEVFALDNWDESRFYDPDGRLRSLYWVPSTRKPDWDYAMYRGAGYVLQHLDARAADWSDSSDFHRHISGVVLFSRANVAAIWERLEHACDLEAVMDRLFNHEPGLAFSDHDFYGIAVDLGLLDEVDHPAPTADLLGWYDRHDDPVFHRFRSGAMWSMCQTHHEHPTEVSYLDYANGIAEDLGRVLADQPPRRQAEIGMTIRAVSSHDGHVVPPAASW